MDAKQCYKYVLSITHIKSLKFAYSLQRVYFLCALVWVLV